MSKMARGAEALAHLFHRMYCELTRARRRWNGLTILLLPLAALGCGHSPSLAAAAQNGGALRTRSAAERASTSVGSAPMARSTAHAPRPIIDLGPALEEAANVRSFSGVVLVAFGYEVIARHAAGFADAAATRPISETSRFVIGSLSKQITASLVQREVEAGRVELDHPISRYVPLRLPWADDVRVRHLLNHTSGIKALDQPLARAPGASFEYSNLGYDLLGQVVERTSGHSFAEAVRALFAHCGIPASGTVDDGSSAVVGFSESADGVRTPQPVPAEVNEHLPSGGLVASAAEFLKWTQCLHSRRAVSEASYRQMTTSSTTRQHRWGPLGYGFGIQVLASDGLLELSHSGYVSGFVSTALIYPVHCVAVVILENVAAPVSDLSRAFAPHDHIRDRVRQALRNSNADEGGCLGSQSSGQ